MILLSKPFANACLASGYRTNQLLDIWPEICLHVRMREDAIKVLYHVRILAADPNVQDRRQAALLQA